MTPPNKKPCEFLRASFELGATLYMGAAFASAGVMGLVLLARLLGVGENERER